MCNSHLSGLFDGVCGAVKHQRRHDEADHDVDHVEHEPGHEEDPLPGPGADPHPDVSYEEHQQPGGEAVRVNVGQGVGREHHEAEIDGDAQNGQDEHSLNEMYCWDFKALECVANALRETKWDKAYILLDAKICSFVEILGPDFQIERYLDI